ncbi:cation diffusion facilitator family transporter [Haliangium ochraceum]|uniref:Cation diffusion facilitator family transporter n=1 Tax=Haliangium ochraceum (strain DSM 14365 / JCM 11303 / SMP-2) TaxID=502025 RepID=D0LPV3_HALO1|nr:cation diffusion facilitator family transporter [Haliangium ochraceum]ACY16990.1 cation diffusion facilitator family transporter [Haliangium ochraceum DSM 14365]
MAAGGKSAVFLALIGNGLLTVIKFGAFLLSRSPAMLSEAIHSFADTANQWLLYLGIRRSERPADDAYHWGYGGERFLFALISAAGIFVLGCGVTVYHGIHSLLDPPEVTTSWVSFAVLGIALVVDGFVFLAAVREVSRQKGERSFMEFVRTSSDPTLLAVLFEDAVATLGVLVALAGIGLGYLTGSPVFDAIASIIIGLLLGMVAIWLAVRNRQLILGPAIPDDVAQGILAYLDEQPSIETVRRVRTRIVGSDRFAFSAEIDYDGNYLGKLQAGWLAERLFELSAGPSEQPDDVRSAQLESCAQAFGERLLDALAGEIDRIEAELRARYPRLAFVDLESDDVGAIKRAKSRAE